MRAQLPPRAPPQTLTSLSSPQIQLRATLIRQLTTSHSPTPHLLSLSLMACAAKFRYQRLKAEGGDGDAGGLVPDDEAVFERYRAIVRSRLWYARLKRVAVKRRFRLRVPGLRRFLRGRARLARAVGVSCAKVLRRLKESQSHFGDLFAGNYLFLQVNPTPVKKLLERSAAGERGRAAGVGGYGWSPKVSVQRIAC
ncbi:hypothetical protein EUGRSUZ_I01721 [Eucalyptus grandis]|uniref:Uncharacterized protein n=2 Tax=Eucalyptus grandis TaxID=71139 RepID=A0A059AQB4_EUCGR|nr:hypothetical protein EUGRSUZ_I01721 [Eucalyptus grandis]